MLNTALCICICHSSGLECCWLTRFLHHAGCKRSCCRLIQRCAKRIPALGKLLARAASAAMLLAMRVGLAHAALVALLVALLAGSVAAQEDVAVSVPSNSSSDVKGESLVSAFRPGLSLLRCNQIPGCTKCRRWRGRTLCTSCNNALGYRLMTNTWTCGKCLLMALAMCYARI